MKRGLTLFAVLASPLFFAATAMAEPGSVIPRTMVHQMAHPAPVPAAVNSHVVFLNKCSGSSCALQNSSGTIDSTTVPKSSDIVNCCDPNGQCTGGNATLGAFPYSQTVWNDMKSCVAKAMAPFNIQVTDTDPGKGVPHFEVMVGGSPGDIGCPDGVGGIADIPQGDFIPNAVVFDFAAVWQQACGNDTTCLVQFLCQTNAQEIAHAWSLDHVVDDTDPMTYNFGFNGQWTYHNGEVCGSDCVDQGNGQLVSPLGKACTGTNPMTATHACFGSFDGGTAADFPGGKQDELAHITRLFGPNNAAPVTAKITKPSKDAGVETGFEIDVTCTSTDPIQEVDISIDGNALSPITSAPYTANAPSTLKNGSHTISATCNTSNQAQGTDMVTVTQGITCNSASDCPNSTDTCANHVCVPGSGAAGGLGTACTSNADCASGECGSDGTDSFCVVACDTGNDGCPSGFGCLPTGGSGSTGGVCWPGANNSSAGDGGGCQTSRRGASPAMILLGLGFAALLLVRKRA